MPNQPGSAPSKRVSAKAYAVRRQFGVVHGMAWCDTCGWETSSYKNAQAIAAQHARKHGHLVRGEVGCAYEYDGRG